MAILDSRRISEFLKKDRKSRDKYFLKLKEMRKNFGDLDDTDRYILETQGHMTSVSEMRFDGRGPSIFEQINVTKEDIDRLVEQKTLTQEDADDLLKAKERYECQLKD